jgi:hypothetical protein
MAHLLPVVLREIDDHERAGRTESFRDAAKRADRSKAYATTAIVATKVAGGILAVFEHIEPRAAGLPTWLDLDVPDDRSIASTCRCRAAIQGRCLWRRQMT